MKSLKAPTDHFDIRRHIQFARNPTKSGTSSKLVHIKALQSSHHHFYFNRIVRLWNHLPEIDTSLSIHTIKNQITAYLWNQFTTSFNSDSLCSYHVFCPWPATAAQDNLSQLTFTDSLTPDHKQSVLLQTILYIIII